MADGSFGIGSELVQLCRLRILQAPVAMAEYSPAVMWLEPANGNAIFWVYFLPQG
jgi:hypothetical protein